MAPPPPPLPSLLLLFLVVISLLLSAAEAKPNVPALYVFGDSTADVGNNNFLDGTQSHAKANFPHNGVDFPLSRPTGRFSNGYNGVDFLALHMGFRRSPLPFLSLANKINHQTRRGEKGVNFASGGSGILDFTGSTISMTKQIENFAAIRSNISMHVTPEQSNLLMSKSMFLISSGGNDIFAFFSKSNAPNESEIGQFIDTLVSAYTVHLKELYYIGARKFGIIDVPPLGCCPYPRSMNPTGSCMEILNELALRFNNAVSALLHDLSSTLKGMKYSVGSSYKVVSNIIKNPSALGYKEIKTACCGAGKFNGESACTPNATYCSDRHRYLYWDLLHPTHTTSKYAALAIYNGSLQFAAPINFRQLVEDNS